MTAIQQDVAEDGLDDLERPDLSDHQSEIERIAAKVEEDHTSEEESLEQLQEDEDFTSPMYRRDDEWYVNARVNGEDMEVPWDHVVSQYQKNSSADRRLQEVSERQRELADYETKLNAYRASMEAHYAQPSSDVGNQQSPSSDATDALYEQYHDALFQGDESKASTLLKKIRTADRPQPNVDVQSIIERTKSEMRLEEKEMQAQGYETRRQQAVDMFNSEYPEITADPSLLAVADRRSAELYQSDPTRDPWDIMQECADYARDWLFNYVDDLGGSNDRKERKQGMEDVSPVNVRAHIGEDQEEQTYSDIISEMKKERGQVA
jgi:hypothetical protein